MSSQILQQLQRVQSSKSILAYQKQNGIDIVFQNISYSVDVKDRNAKRNLLCRKPLISKTILRGISGIFKAGKVSAIMGASGAGKTTLLNILTCRIRPNTDGKLYANKLQYTYKNFGDFANYVMQNDFLMETMTVRETLQFAADLKLNTHEDKKKKILMQLVHDLKLEKCIDNLIGGVVLKGISGGQKKRTSIAYQLISNPQVVFLDEPTSGLDSLTSYIIVSYLKKIAIAHSKTIIMTIHQPNSQTFALFDYLTVLLQGKIIYQAESSLTIGYLAMHMKLKCRRFINPADFIMSKIHVEDEQNRKKVPQFIDQYEKTTSTTIKNMISQKATNDFTLRKNQIGTCTILSALLRRNLRNTIKNPMILLSRALQGMVVNLFIGGIFFGLGDKDYTVLQNWLSITGFLFFMSISSLMASFSPVAITFPLERQVFLKQQDSKMYTIFEYFLCRSIAQLPINICLPLLTVPAYYFMVGLNLSAQGFFFHWFVLVMMLFVGSSLGMLIGSIVSDAKSIMPVVSVVVSPLILFAGYFKNRQDLPKWVGWIEFISPNRYCFIAYLNNQVQHKSSLINHMNFDVNKEQAIGILFVLGIFFRLLSLFLLWALRKKRQ